MPKKHLFLLGQTLSRLRDLKKSGERRKQVCGTADDKAGGRDGKAKANPWDAIGRNQVRRLAVGESPQRRVAVACDAGLGKSTTVSWVEYRMAAGRGGRRMPLVLGLDARPDPEDE